MDPQFPTPPSLFCRKENRRVWRTLEQIPGQGGGSKGDTDFSASRTLPTQEEFLPKGMSALPLDTFENFGAKETEALDPKSEPYGQALAKW